METFQERRLHEYATGNKKRRRDGVANSGSRGDVKTAEHYSGARRGIWRHLTSSKEQTSESDDESSIKFNRHGDGKRQRDNAAGNRDESYRQQEAAAVAHHRRERAEQARA